MKQLYLFFTILVFSFNYLNAQTVTVTGSCYYLVDGDYSYNGDINEKPSFYHSPEGTSIYLISWTGTRWELTAEDTTGYILIGSYNTLDTPNPPASSLAAWTPDECNPSGVFSGDGTSTTMSIQDVEKENLNIFPNPSTDYITLSGLNKKEGYSIYSVFGVKILKGSINDNEKIDIRNFATGLYLLKFDNGYTIKFIKG